MDKENLRNEIERVWGPYSQQAQTYKSILNESTESQKSLRAKPAVTISENKESGGRPSYSFGWREVSQATLTFYLTRAAFILGIWSIVVIITAISLFALSLLI